MTRRIPTARIGPVGLAADREPDFDWSWTEDGPAWVAPTVDTRSPSVARMYDYALGGKDNYALDRAAADQILELVPDAVALARANRDFVLRSVTLMAEAGIRQFLDLGCGIPSSPAVHEVARALVPDARVAYVDHDPVVIAQARAVLDGQPGLRAVLHDLREPRRVLGDPGLCSVFRPEEPVGVIMGSVLHFIDLTIGVQIVSHYLSKIAPGSHVALSVATGDGVAPTLTRDVGRILRAASAPIAFRTRAQVEELVDGFDLLSPGLTDVTQWRTDGTPGTMRLWAGVAVKPPP